MTRVLHGIVHGRSITLDEDPGLAEGLVVEVTTGPAHTFLKSLLTKELRLGGRLAINRK